MDTTLPLPTGSMVETKVGLVRMHAIDEDSMYVSGNAEGACVEVRGVRYAASMRLIRTERGFEREDAPYVSSVDGRPTVPSEVRREISEAFLTAGRVWADENPAEFVAAAEVQRHNAVVGVRERIAELEESLARSKASLVELEARTFAAKGESHA